MRAPLLLCAVLWSLGCNSAVAPKSQLQLTVHLGKSEFFEGEPLYVVFDLASLGPDTAWTLPFNRVSWNLRGDLRRSDGTLMPEGGVVVDYAYPPAYKGQPVPPGRHEYDVLVMQEFWGLPAAELRDLYFGGRNLPPGQYEFTAVFTTNLRGNDVLESAPIVFSVRTRSATEDSAMQAVIRLVGMAWDTLQRPSFLSSLVASVAARDGHDPFVPYLAGPLLGTASALGYLPDSEATKQLFAAQEAAAEAQRNLAGGAFAALGAYSRDRSSAPILAEELKGSLAGVIVEWIMSKHASAEDP